VPESPFNADLTSYVLTQDAAAAIIAGALNVAPNDNVAVRNLETGAWEVSAGLSIGAAAGLAADGDAIEVAAGTYAESLTIDKPSATSMLWGMRARILESRSIPALPMCPS